MATGQRLRYLHVRGERAHRHTLGRESGVVRGADLAHPLPRLLLRSVLPAEAAYSRQKYAPEQELISQPK